MILRNFLVITISIFMLNHITFAQTLDELRDAYNQGQYRQMLPALLAYADGLGDAPNPEVDYMIASSWCKIDDARGATYLRWTLEQEPSVSDLPIFDPQLPGNCVHGVPLPKNTAGLTGKARRTNGGQAGVGGKTDSPSEERYQRSQVLRAFTNLTGTWRFTMSSSNGGGVHTGNMYLTQRGTELSGTMNIEGRIQTIRGTFNGQSVQLERDTGQETIQKYALVRFGNTMTGQFQNEGKYPDSGSLPSFR